MKHYMADKAYVFDNARLMSEWDWEENDRCELDPKKLTLGSGKKANWVCTKGHKWVASMCRFFREQESFSLLHLHRHQIESPSDKGIVFRNQSHRRKGSGSSLAQE